MLTINEIVSLCEEYRKVSGRKPLWTNVYTFIHFCQRHGPYFQQMSWTSGANAGMRRQTTLSTTGSKMLVASWIMPTNEDIPMLLFMSK